MSRTAPTRRTRTRAALLAAVLAATGAGLAPGAVAAPGAPVVGIDQLDVDPTWRTAPRAETVVAVGAGGYAHRAEDSDRSSGELMEWTDFATGASRSLGYGDGNDAYAEFGTGGRYAYVDGGYGSSSLLDLETGSATALTVPEDSTYEGLVGDRLIFREYEPGTSLETVRGYAVRAANAPGGPSVPVTGWPDGTNLRTARLVAGAPGVAVFRFTRGESGMSRDYLLGVVDLTTGRVQVLEAPTVTDGLSAAGVTVTAERIAWVDPDRTVHIRSRADLTGPETSYPLPEGLSATRIGLVGDWLLTTADTGSTLEDLTRRLVAVSPAGEQRTLLAGAEERITQVGDGSGTAAVTGGTSATDWAVLKAVPGKGGGAPVLEKLRRVAPLPTDVVALALGMGRLTTLEQDSGKEAGFQTRTLPVGPLHTGQSAPMSAGTEAGAQWYETPLFDAGDGRTVSSPRITYTPRAVVSRKADGRTTRVRVDQNGQVGQVADAFGRWAVYQTGTPGGYGELAGDGETLVLDMDGQRIVSRQKQVAAALWGDTLFTGTSTTGQVARKDLATGKTLGTLATGSGCPLTELQTAGRWLYWACAGYAKQGVLDLRNPSTPVAVALPRGSYRGGLLGDGYFVDENGSYLRVTPFATGKAGAPYDLTRAEPVSGVRRTTWTVDRFGGAVAYRGADQRVHAVWTDIPTSDLTAASSSVPASLRLPGTWKGSWTLSKPAGSYEVNIRDAYSWKAVRTVRANETRGRIDVTWDGRNAAGLPVPNGPYVWELRATTADGKGRDLVATGRFPVSGSRPAFRDLAGNDALGDLLAVDTAGAVSLYRGNGYGKFGARTAGSGGAFPGGTLLVPFGDVNADGCADVLGRVGGELRAYRPGCGKVVTASAPYTPVGSGWSQYDVLTSPGDVNGDGYADLIARQTTTGDMYFYGGTADHRLKTRVRIGTDWKLYKKVTGAGDLDGDGRGDLLAVDGSGVLWSYFGTSTGGVTPRAKVGGGWQVYSAVQGVGDLDGDGDSDLVARDTSGRLYAYYSYGRGRTGDRFGYRELVGSGWNTFRALF
ncbi:FG-GAP-like repeat-containing protein [Streptomyces sp. NRRL F-5727]|uniref:FG-GAP-like repeat-containing protein n=1 Tax=Streptomyces sp. NRRL F-5727 TaxID=1463871 RepID=UPI00068F4558|nr:FG-GAP-like repeat-containing protein [Streptomyces sp. NRRL F-5727]